VQTSPVWTKERCPQDYQDMETHPYIDEGIIIADSMQNLNKFNTICWPNWRATIFFKIGEGSTKKTL